MTDAELAEKAKRLRNLASLFPNWHPYWLLVDDARTTLQGGRASMPRLRLEAEISDVVADRVWRVEASG